MGVATFHAVEGMRDAVGTATTITGGREVRWRESIAQVKAVAPFLSGHDNVVMEKDRYYGTLGKVG